jgi:hypothetical protein
MITGLSGWKIYSDSSRQESHRDCTKFIIGGIGWLVLVAAGVFVDIYLFLIGGIREIVHGAEATPVNGNQIGWGAAHIIFSGVGFAAAILLGIGLTALLAVWETDKSYKGKHRKG